MDPRLIIGEPEDVGLADLLDHFEPCPACGQMIDLRDLAAVLHHEDAGHEPLPIAEATRLLTLR
jgi:hypothetical protein